MEDLINALEILRLEHHECEDPWYSCWITDSYQDVGWGNPRICSCGAERHNAVLDGIIERIRQWM